MDTTRLDPPNAQPLLKIDPILLGTCCGIASAICYTLANIYLRAVVRADPIWVSCVKSIPTILLIGPWMIVRHWRGQRTFPGMRVLLIILAAGLFGQVVGNVPFQWSLGVLGMALVVPLVFGTMIISGAVMGRVLLHEPLLPRTLVSIVLLVSAVFTLSLGAEAAHRSMKQAAAAAHSPPTGPDVELLGAEALGAGDLHRDQPATGLSMVVVGGVLAACLAGFAYSTLGVAIRYGVTNHAPISTTLMLVGVIGLVILGSMSFARIGVAGMLATDPQDLWRMLMAGVANAVAFAALTKGLQLISVVYVNALNATQVTMAVLAGVIYYQEPWSITLIVGALLTVCGLAFMRGRERHIAAQKAAQAAGLLDANKSANSASSATKPAQVEA